MKWLVLAPLILLGILAFLLLAALLLRVGVCALYRGGQPEVWAKAAFVNIRLFPRKPRRAKKKGGARAQKSAQPPAAAAGRGAKQRAEPSPKDAPGSAGASPPAQPLSVERLCAYAKLFVDAGGRLARGLRVDKLWLRADIGTPDAAKTAMAYGGAAAAVSALWPLLERRLDIRKKDIYLNACFDKEQTDIEGEVILTAMVWRVVIIVLRFLKQYKKLKKAVQTNEQSQ